MSVEIGQKNLNFEEIYSVSVSGALVKVSKVLSNELSDGIPKKIPASQVEQIDLVLDNQVLRKTEYLKAYYLIVLSHLARMKKAGRKSIVELLVILLNSRALPKGSLDEKSNIIECLCNTIKEGGMVELNGEEQSFKEIIENSQSDEDEEEKKELPEPLSEITPQEFFVINSVDKFHLAVYAIETFMLEKFSKRLYTSFALAFQAIKVPID